MSEEKPQLTDAMVKDFVQSFPKTRFIGTCKDCKWWSTDTPCMTACPARACLNVKTGLARETENREAAVNILSYDYELFTGPDFGCVHWEAKQ